MKRLRWPAIMLALTLILAACGGDDDDDAGGGLGDDDDTTETTVADEGDEAQAACEGATLQAGETGVTAETITIAVTADTGSPLRPGLFQGSVDGVKAWAEYKNANGGVGCRQVVVEEYDSMLSAEEAKNSVVGACGTSIAMVGTTALFLNEAAVAEMEGCTIPDIAVLQTEPAQQCSDFSYPIIAGTGACPYAGEGERTYRERAGAYRYYLDEYGADGELHGVWVIPSDLPSTITASMPGFRVSQQMGIGLDYETGLSALSDQSAYTPVVQEIKDNSSTYARVGLDYKGTVFLRKEAEVQGVDSVLVWDCSVQCYDKKLIEEGGASVEGQYVWISLLPLEDGDANESLANLLEYNPDSDGFGAQAWAAGELFAQIVDEIVATDGPNAITRAAILDGVKNAHDFDAGGLIPASDVGGKNPNGCFVLMQVTNGEFTRVLPEEPGTFECPDEDEIVEITLDPVAEYQG